ncbi:MAG: DUF1573 domain-containing protein [Chitinophagales bacterium]|nr:DUF1573 domain-containing protein [Chitinophagales bacterium]
MRLTNLFLFIISVCLCIQTYIQVKQFSQPNAITTSATPPPAEGVAPINSIPDLPPTAVQFSKTTHDFGIIKDDKKQYTTFEFTNSGKEPLMILGAEGSCGCTVPTWPKEPIAPGESGKIEVAFDPNGKSGEQSKIVTITANTEPKTTILTVKATIVKSN